MGLTSACSGARKRRLHESQAPRRPL